MLFSVNVLAVVDVFPLFHLIVPVLFEPLLADATVVVQFCFVIFVVDVLVPPVIPATPLQPVRVADSFTVEFTVVESPIFGSGGVHVSVPANVLHFGGNGPAAPAGAATHMPIGRSIATTTNSPKPLRITPLS